MIIIPDNEGLNNFEKCASHFNFPSLIPLGSCALVHACIDVLHGQRFPISLVYFCYLQWAYGVTCWEIFSGGKVPYAELIVREIPKLLEEKYRLEKPSNIACSEEM